MTRNRRPLPPPQDLPRDLPAIAFTPEEAAKILTVGRTAIYDLMKAKRLRPVKIGNKNVIALREIERFLADEAVR